MGEMGSPHMEKKGALGFLTLRMEDNIVHIARTAGGILLLLDLWRAQVGERPVRALLPPITREHSHACWRSDQLVSANVDEDLQKQE